MSCLAVINLLIANQGRRHLVRLWLRDPELAWRTPEALRERWERVYADVSAENTVFPLEPSIRSASKGESPKSEGSRQ